MWKTIRLAVLSASILLLSVPLAWAQESSAVPTTLSVATSFVGIAAKPGDTASFPVDVAAPPGSRVRLEVTSLPEGWNGRLQGGGYIVDEILVGDDGHVDVDLGVDIPPETPENSYGFTLVATSDAGERAQLDLTVRVAAEAAGEVTMSTDFPSLQGPPDSTYSFTVTLDNGTPQETQFGLGAEAPEGWSVDVQPAGESRASTVTVAGGGTASLTINVDPPDNAQAGQYPITVRAEGDGKSATVDLGVEITGTYSLDMATAGEVLNVDVSAGEPSNLDLVLVNSGTAPLLGVDLSAVPPRGWDVTFDRETIDQLAPGETATVTAQITPSEDAINGDYIVSFAASVPETRADIDIRSTVSTSAVWGVVGIGIIVLALVGLSLVFRTYGRR